MTKNSQRPRVLYASFEADPFGKTGGLGEVGGSLPQALQKAGADVRVILPKLPAMPAELAQKLEHAADFPLELAWRRQYCGVEHLTYRGLEYYFIDNEYYFKRGAFYGFDDDGERIAFFAKAVLAALPHLGGFWPQLLHCNDWHTALVPVLLREQFREQPGYAGIKTLFAVHNLKFQGKFDPFLLGDVLGLADNRAAREQLIRDGALNYMLGGLCYADCLLTVSPAYAAEVCTPEFGEGLDDVFRRRAGVLHGVLNGIDTNVYAPASDPLLPRTFSADEPSGKAFCKAAAQREFGLRERPDLPLFGLISRLTEQKGLDLLLAILSGLLEQPLQVAVLGVGDAKYENAFRSFGEKYANFAVRFEFSDRLAHLLYAGGDALLMPSRFEPCGLAQMIAMRYGALPIVRETGGLKDSVLPYDQNTGAGTGFSFAGYDARELLAACQNALAVYHERPDVWRGLRRRAMTRDLSWDSSARRYVQIYRQILGE